MAVFLKTIICCHQRNRHLISLCKKSTVHHTGYFHLRVTLLNLSAAILKNLCCFWSDHTETGNLRICKHVAQMLDICSNILPIASIVTGYSLTGQILLQNLCLTFMPKVWDQFKCTICQFLVHYTVSLTGITNHIILFCSDHDLGCRWS